MTTVGTVGSSSREFACSLRSTARLLEEWKGYEMGSWEDHGRPDDKDESVASHPYVIFGRARTRLMFNLNEGKSLIESGLNAADIAMDTPGMHWFTVGVHKLLSEIEDRIS
jgi:hypothetical protein